MKRPIARWAGVSLLLALLSTAPKRALAEADAPSVLILGAPEAPLTGRLRAELVALGLSVVVAPSAGASRSQGELEARAREADAAVALEISDSPAGVEIWLVDRVTGKTLKREVLARDRNVGDPDAVVAVRAVELLRASLLELELEHPSRGELAPSDELRKAARQSEPDRASAGPTPSFDLTQYPQPGRGSAWILGAGIALGVELTATNPAPALSLQTWWEPVARVAAGVWSVLPIASATVSEPEGSAKLRDLAGGIGMRFGLMDESSRWSPTLGTGASVLWTHLEGERVRAGLVAQAGDLVTFGPHAQAGLGFRFSERWVLRSEVLALFTFPRAAAVFAGREVLLAGRPFVAWTFGIEYRAINPARRD